VASRLFKYAIQRHWINRPINLYYDLLVKFDDFEAHTPLSMENTDDPTTESIELRTDGLLLRFSSNLLSFLASREDRRRFRLSDWLQSLDEDRLGHLQQLAETALHDPQANGGGVVGFCPTQTS